MIYLIKMKTRSQAYFLVCVMIILTCVSNSVHAQATISGKVTYQTDNGPAENATIEFVKQKEKSFSDKSGNFSIYIPKIKNDDTLLISTVGYETIRVPVTAALKKSEFVLVEKTKVLENVTLYNKHESVGSTSESVGYFRSWNAGGTGGEVGRIFSLPYKGYKIDKIRFKVSNLCDTCLLRLHIRNVVNGEPAEEIMKDSITLTINKLTLDDKVSEFDISNYDFTFTQKEMFVSLEVLNCRSKEEQKCSFCFAGTEKGEYTYKSAAEADWKTINDYTIYLKLFLRY